MGILFNIKVCVVALGGITLALWPYLLKSANQMLAGHSHCISIMYYGSFLFKMKKEKYSLFGIGYISK